MEKENINWRIEIDQALCGGRELAIMNIGSIEDYFEEKLSRSSEYEIDQNNFIEALKEVVYNWNVYENKDAVYLNYLLCLIGYYTPSIGYIKVFEFLKYWINYKELNQKESYNIKSIDIYKKGLIVLQQYIPIVPLEKVKKELGYENYEKFLYSLLEHPDFSGYAFGRAIMLGLINLADSTIDEFIQNQERNYVDALFIILEEPLDYYLSEKISQIYNSSIIYDKISTLLKAFEKVGIKLITTEDGDYIKTRSGKVVPLELPRDPYRLGNVLQQLYSQDVPQGRSLLRSIRLSRFN